MLEAGQPVAPGRLEFRAAGASAEARAPFGNQATHMAGGGKETGAPSPLNRPTMRALHLRPTLTRLLAQGPPHTRTQRGPSAFTGGPECTVLGPHGSLMREG